MKVLVVLLVIVMPIISHADSWNFEAKEISEEFVFGDTKIVKTVDGTENQQYPEFGIDIYYRGDLQAKYKGISFQSIFAIKENTVFIGLSNDGIPGTAIVVFTSKGELNVEIKHHLGNFEYCQKSITLERIWYDENNPDLKLVNADGKDEEIMFTDCTGKRVGLNFVLAKAYNKVTEQ